MCRIRFEPWIGSRYDLCRDPRPPIFGEQSRVLILGQSHYTHDGDDQYTRDFTSKQVIKLRNRRNYFFSNIQEACVGPANPNGITPENFWHSVAFYNYVQWFVPQGRDRPQIREFNRMFNQMLNESRDAFLQCLNCLRPTHVIVCGITTLWRHLRNYPRNNSDFCQAVPDHYNEITRLGCYHYEDGRCLIMAIKDPSTPGFRAQDWHPMLQAFFAFQPPQH